jgi:hypothetical protein
MSSSMMMMDNAMATRDATQTIPMIANPLGASWWDALIAQIQQLFARIGMLLTDIEGRLDMNLSQIESSVLGNPALTPAARQRVMNRLDASQMMINNRFDQARMNLMGADTSTIAGLQRARMAGGRGEMMVDLGGGDMVPARFADLHGRHGMPKHIPSVFDTLPPGLAKRRMLPPGLARRQMLPPGLEKRVPIRAALNPASLLEGGVTSIPNMNLRFNR